LFSKWVAQHNKKYTHENFFYRYTVFKHNMDRIVAHNKKGKSYTMAMNSFGDMTGEEFKATHTGYNWRDQSHYRAHNKPVVSHKKPVANPTQDWVKKGKVTGVKNQQQCGSCWAFSATGSLEGAHAIKTGKLVSFSEQQLVDCSRAQGNQGCNGGLMDQAFQYMEKNKMCPESEYPYTAVDGQCQAPHVCKDLYPVITGFQDVASMDENALMKAADVGPVSIAIEADQQVFQFYSSGVLDDDSCGTQLDHGVLVVGYNTDSASGSDYWTVKNSWGTGWGQAGYVWIVRGKNMCGLATEPSYPTV
jgi:cathepsin L